MSCSASSWVWLLISLLAEQVRNAFAALDTPPATPSLRRVSLRVPAASACRALLLVAQLQPAIRWHRMSEALHFPLPALKNLNRSGEPARHRPRRGVPYHHSMCRAAHSAHRMQGFPVCAQNDPVAGLTATSTGSITLVGLLVVACLRGGWASRFSGSTLTPRIRKT
eukprot:2785324-Prymnesium_polylepis.2